MVAGVSSGCEVTGHIRGNLHMWITVARWLIFRPEGSEFGGRPHGGARGELDKKEIKRTGVTIWFAKGWKKRGEEVASSSVRSFLKDGFGM